MNKLLTYRFTRRNLGRWTLAAVGLASLGTRDSRVFAQDATPTIITGVTIEPLVDLVIPRETIPDEKYSVAFLQGIIPSSSQSTWTMTGRRVLVMTVVEGTMHCSPADKARVIRANGVDETLAEGDDLVLHVGETFVDFGFDEPNTYGNPDTTDCTWVGMTIDPPGYGSEETETNVGGSIRFPWATFLNDSDWPRAGLANSSVRTVMRRVTIEPGMSMETVSLFPVLRAIPNGSLRWLIKREGQETTASALVISGIPYFPYKPGDIDVLTNESEDPVVMYELFLTPINDEPATPIS